MSICENPGDRLLSSLLYPLGITAQYTGYYYAICAVELAADDPSHLIMVTKDLYPAVAARLSSTASRVERNLRHVSDLAWRTNPRLLETMAGHPLKQRPCASQFIAILTNQYRILLSREDPNGQQRLF